MGDYFEDSGGVPEEGARFIDVYKDLEALAFSEGLEFRPLVGRNVMLSFVSFEPNVEAPVHSHVEEQLICVISGKLAVTLGDEERTLGPGEVAVVPPYVPHGARSLDEPCWEVDVFQPPRQALLDLLSDDQASH